MARPSVSVVIPAYNTAPYIGETLSSVLAQTYTDFEVIVVNDGSPDTVELEVALAPFRDRIQYIVQENGGLSAARNRGIAAGRGEFVALLDSDDVWEPDYLEYQLAVLERDGLDIVYSNATTFGDPLRAGRLFMDMHPSTGAGVDRVARQPAVQRDGVGAGASRRARVGRSFRRVVAELGRLRHVAAGRSWRWPDRLPPAVARTKPAPARKSVGKWGVDVSAHRARARQGHARPALDAE